MSEWTVGQKVFVYWSRNSGWGGRNGRGDTTTVAKIGRKWGVLGDHTETRFHLDGGAIDGKGYVSPGRVYENESVYLAQKARVDQWRVLCELTRSALYPPPHVSTENINAAIAAISKE